MCSRTPRRPRCARRRRSDSDRFAGEPTKFKRSWKKGGKAKLTWKKSRSTAAAPVAGYFVYVNGKKKATLGKGSASYTVKGLKKGKKYSFSIKSRNAVGTSSSVKIGGKKRP